MKVILLPSIVLVNYFIILLKNTGKVYNSLFYKPVPLTIVESPLIHVHVNVCS